MRHISALIIKTLMISIVLLVVMSGIFGFPVIATFGLSLLIVVISYILGDLGILRITNNVLATIADLGITTLIIWIIGQFIFGYPVPIGIAFISAIVISVGEWFFHKYIFSIISRERHSSPQR